MHDRICDLIGVSLVASLRPPPRLVSGDAAPLLDGVSGLVSSQTNVGTNAEGDVVPHRECVRFHVFDSFGNTRTCVRANHPQIIGTERALYAFKKGQRAAVSREHSSQRTCYTSRSRTVSVPAARPQPRNGPIADGCQQSHGRDCLRGPRPALANCTDLRRRRAVV